MRLLGKVAIVTGGARGIGLETAALFAKHGAKVVIADMDEENGGKQAEQLRGQGFEARFIHVDVADKTSADDMARQTIEACGTIDILVNNAGIIQDKMLRSMTVEQWQKVIDVNLSGRRTWWNGYRST